MPFRILSTRWPRPEQVGIARPIRHESPVVYILPVRVTSPAAGCVREIHDPSSVSEQEGDPEDDERIGARPRNRGEALLEIATRRASTAGCSVTRSALAATWRVLIKSWFVRLSDSEHGNARTPLSCPLEKLQALAFQLQVESMSS